MNTLKITKIKRPEYGEETDCKEGFVEVIGNVCYISTSGFCFVEGINYLTSKDYNQKILDFITDEKKPSIVMTKARLKLDFFVIISILKWDLFLVQKCIRDLL